MAVAMAPPNRRKVEMAPIATPLQSYCQCLGPNLDQNYESEENGKRLNLHICLVFQVERDHAKDHVERLVDKTRHQEHQGDGFTLVVNTNRGKRANKCSLAADEAEYLPLLVANTSAENPDRDQRD